MGSKSSSPSKSSASPNAPPPRPKKPDLEAHRCHIALDDETIAKALSRANLPRCQPPPAADGPGGAEGPPEGRQQRLSDVSMSTSSSDSLDNSRSPGFSLSLAPPPPPHLGRQDAVEDSSEEDEDGEEEDDEDYGVGLEADLETRFRPSYKARRRRAGVSLNGTPFVLPRSLRGRFSKVSGMLSSLMTPDRRAVKRITELSRNKSTYFGCLVQDYVSFVQENRSCHTSGVDFLQTVRQFMTQMKAYLRQTSELDPPIESLIPEDQIGESDRVSWFRRGPMTGFKVHPQVSRDNGGNVVLSLPVLFLGLRSLGGVSVGVLCSPSPVRQTGLRPAELQPATSPFATFMLVKKRG